MNATARIRTLRESIARRALTATGIPTDARILNVQRAGSMFIVATAEPDNRWAPYSVDVFRIPTADNTDPDYDESTAPKVWTALAGWGGADMDEMPGMLAKATTYARDIA
ncbi:hypothetical protein ACIQ9J_01490 [Streptomyces sp. NPDC094153]|uniref:hypothetical protein n=1 Tax=Streptomyces sp. NPDC094153 TaxID=3366058 RepID=UPI0037FEC464